MTRRRVSRFVVVGAAGFVVQMTVAALLLRAGMMPVVATLLAIEAAIVSNHAWHRRWAWRERTHDQPWRLTLLRAHLGAGGTSLVVGTGVVAALSGRVATLTAQVLAVVVCATVNYLLTDKWVFGTGERRRGAALVACLLLAAPAAARADGPSPKALASWDRYVGGLEKARESDLSREVPAWSLDDDPQGARVRATLARGEIDVTRREIAGADVDDATLEHWQGSILLKGVTLPQAIDRLRHPERFPQPRDVLAMKVSGWTDDGHELYLRLTRSMLVTATYDTWHRVRHQVRSATRVDSASLATRIEEIHDLGQPSERRARLEDSRGFLWRMQSFWRFTAVPEGVIVTCESITLSRPVPTGLGLVSRPIVNRVARESMTTAITAWRSGWR